MNKGGRMLQRVLLCLAMAAAVLLMVILGGRYLRDGRTLLAKQQELKSSRETWEGIAAEKEALQAELKEVRNSLKEAELTLEESTARAEELEKEIETLRAEIQALRGGE